MRSLITTTALVLAVSVSAGARAQTEAPQAQGAQPAVPAQAVPDTGAMQLQQRLESVSRQLRGASGDQLEQARAEAREALEEVRNALPEAPQDRHQRIQESLVKAETALQGEDAEAAAQAFADLRQTIDTASTGVQQQGLAAQSEIQVDQPAAQVQVQQPAPEIAVQQPAPQVTVQQPAPEITVTQPEPNVTVTQPEPEVTVVQPEPEVQVEQAGEARVEVEPAGQPEVEVTDQAAMAEQSPLHNMQGHELVGQSLRGANDDTVGEIEDVIVGRDGAIALLVGVGGFLGIGESSKAIPLEAVELRGEEIVASMTREEIEALPEYDEAAYDRMPPDRPLGSSVN